MVVDIAYTNPAIEYSGRWVVQEHSIGSRWQGSQIRFRVSGSRTITFNVDVRDASETGVTVAVANVDGGEHLLHIITSASETFSGSRRVTFELPSTAPHDLVIKLYGTPVDQWSGQTYVGLKTIELDHGATIASSESPWAMKVEFVGDSWMATQNDWPFLLKGYSVSPVSFGGATIDMLDKQYLYDGAGSPAAKFQRADAVVIGSGVNDYNRAVPVTAYKQSMLSLINKVRHAHPGSKIILLQAPASPNGKDYGKYGAVMSEIALANRDVTYVPFPRVTPHALEWRGDGLHLTYKGLKQLSSIMQPALDKALLVNITAGIQ